MKVAEAWVWASSDELRVTKWDDIFHLLYLNYRLIRKYCPQKKMHLAHFELPVMFDNFHQNLTNFSFFHPFTATYLKLQGGRVVQISSYSFRAHKQVEGSVRIKKCYRVRKSKIQKVSELLKKGKSSECSKLESDIIQGSHIKISKFHLK